MESVECRVKRFMGFVYKVVELSGLSMSKEQWINVMANIE